MNENDKKKVDENWKQQIEKEREQTKANNKAYHEPNFIIFLSSLTMQAMIAAGKLENPLTGKKETSLDQARFLIDTIQVIKDKTKNNLTPDEQTLLDDSLFNLRMMYVEIKNEKKPGS